LRRRGDARLAHLLEDGQLVVAAEKLARGQHLEQHRGQRKDVGALVDVAPPGLLGDMYCSLPLSAPACVCDAFDAAFAIPKSQS